jgi:hypothetical protein
MDNCMSQSLTLHVCQWDLGDGMHKISKGNFKLQSRALEGRTLGQSERHPSKKGRGGGKMETSKAI